MKIHIDVNDKEIQVLKALKLLNVHNVWRSDHPSTFTRCTWKLNNLPKVTGRVPCCVNTKMTLIMRYTNILPSQKEKYVFKNPITYKTGRFQKR